MVAGGCFLVLIANAILFNLAAAPTHPVLVLKVITLISLIWMFAGAWGMAIRKAWGRAMALTVLYAGSLGYFLTTAVALTDTQGGSIAGRLSPFIIATVVYTFVSFVLTRSRHIRRLTSRTWE
jgi:uncharacterized membrane protein